jgi:hypothetical protein
VKTLKLSKDVELPVDVVTERLALVGQSGSGKTYAAMRLGELMLDAGAQIIALDPMAVWWGLLSAANGQASGYPVHVFGGEHAHVPIVPEAGALVAGVIVERGISAVIDIANFTRSDQVMFSSAFAERFYELQVKVKRPVHLFFEEAHSFLPQNLPAEGRGGDPRKNPAVMLNRMERIVRQGRSQGVGCSMITQQPQAVNKAALNQAGTLIAMRTMGKHERKAIGDWMADKATDDSQLKLDQLLPKLGTGEAWVASPHFLSLFKHTHISKKTTFDSSATPKFGVKLEAPKVLADVDVEALRESMKTVVEQVEKDDPAPLRRRIAELERQLATKAKVVEQVEVPVLKGAELKALEAAIAKATTVHQKLLEGLDPLQNALELANGALYRLSKPAVKVAAPSNGHAHARPVLQTPVPAIASTVPTIDGCDLGARKMLAELAAVHPAALTRRELATRTVMAHGGSSFRTYISQLRSRGLVEDSAGGDLVATAAGLEAAKGAKPASRNELVALWGQKLDRAARVMLDHLLGAQQPLQKDQLAELANVTPGGSSHRTYLSQLRSAGLMEAEGRGLVAGHALFIGEAP